MLNWTHASAALLKALFSLVCFLTWVNHTNEEVTSKKMINLIHYLIDLKIIYHVIFDLWLTSC